MVRIEKTVFISYRRTNASWALAIFQHLSHLGYDVFFDFNGIAGGDFESIILENVRARAHFLVLLTPSALERCSQPRDWLRREIVTAIQAKRNIVPLMFEGFKFSTPVIAQQLTGRLRVLSRYNALNVPADYFTEAMQRLQNKFLNVALDSVSHPASSRAQRAAKRHQAAAGAAPETRKEKLTAETYFERGFSAVDSDEKIRLFTEAIRLKPDYATAYSNRALARGDKGDLEGAQADYDQAIRLRPDDTDASNVRANGGKAEEDSSTAVIDFEAPARIHAKQAKTQRASKAASPPRSKEENSNTRKHEVGEVDPPKVPEVQTRARRLLEEPRKLERTKELKRKTLTPKKKELKHKTPTPQEKEPKHKTPTPQKREPKRKTPTPQQKEPKRKTPTPQKKGERRRRRTGQEERGRNNRRTAQVASRKRALEPRRRKPAKAGAHTAKPIVRTRRSEAVRARERERRVAQDAAADRVLGDIRSERRREADLRRLEKERHQQELERHVPTFSGLGSGKPAEPWWRKLLR